MDITVNNNMWLGIGFGNQMKNTDMLVLQGTDTGLLFDGYATGHAPPSRDPQQDVTFTVTRSADNNFVFTAYRQLVIDDPRNYNITLSQQFPMIWAENMMTSDYTKFHSYYGFFSTTLNPDGTNILMQDVVKQKIDKIIVAHGILMWLCWSVFGFVMVSTNRWYSYKSDISQYVHGAIGITILALTIGFVAGIINHYGLNIFSNIHTILGWSTTLSATFVALGGITTNLIKKFTKWNTPKILLIKKMHRAGSYFVLLLSYITLTFGLL